MKAGYKRLKKNIDAGISNPKEFLEDTRAIAAESPEMADIFSRMIKAELEAIKPEKLRGKLI